jgi:hypothetical protein
LEILTNPLSEEALRVKIMANGVKINVESQLAKKGDMLLSSAALVLNNPM